jgi:hypothetical protein
MDYLSDHIDFDAQCGDWKVVKQLEIKAGTKPEQIAKLLSEIRAEADAMTYKKLGIKTDLLNAAAKSIAKGGKADYDSLSKSISSLSGSEAKKAIKESVPDKKLEPLALSYLLAKVISESGFPASGQII